MSSYEIVQRPSQLYAVISLTTTMVEIGRTAPALNGEVFDWLTDRGVAPQGPNISVWETVLSFKLHN